MGAALMVLLFVAVTWKAWRDMWLALRRLVIEPPDRDYMARNAKETAGGVLTAVLWIVLAAVFWFALWRFLDFLLSV
jgi:cbb3-type cytochrome oxidase subunit 3